MAASLNGMFWKQLARTEKQKQEEGQSWNADLETLAGGYIWTSESEWALQGVRIRSLAGAKDSTWSQSLEESSLKKNGQ